MGQFQSAWETMEIETDTVSMRLNWPEQAVDPNLTIDNVQQHDLRKAEMQRGQFDCLNLALSF